MTYQKLIIIGRLGKDPEMRFTPAGQPVTSFSVATDRQYADQSGKQVKETIWFRVQAWGKLAETCKNFLQKGKLVMVEGRLSVDASTGAPKIWTDQSGNPRTNLEIVAGTVKFLSGGQQQEQTQQEQMQIDTGEDIPF